MSLDALLRLAESRASSRRGRTAALVALGALVGWAVVDTIARAVTNDVEAVHIGAKPFTEQRVLAAALARTVERAGARADVKTSLGTTVAFDALVHGELDLYVEYVLERSRGPTMMGRSDMPRDGDAVGREVEAWLKSKGGRSGGAARVRERLRPRRAGGYTVPRPTVRPISARESALAGSRL